MRPEYRGPRRAGPPAPAAAAGAGVPEQPAPRPDQGPAGEALEPAAPDRHLHRTERHHSDGRHARSQDGPAGPSSAGPDTLDRRRDNPLRTPGTALVPW